MEKAEWFETPLLVLIAKCELCRVLRGVVLKLLVCLNFLNKSPKSFVPHTCKVWLFDIDSICSLRFLCVKFGHIFEEYVVIPGTEVASFPQKARKI